MERESSSLPSLPLAFFREGDFRELIAFPSDWATIPEQALRSLFERATVLPPAVTSD